MLGLYVHRHSPIHAFPAGGKLAALAAAATAALFVSDPVVLWSALAAGLLLFPLARLPLRTAWQQLRPVLPILLLLLAVQAAIAGWQAGAAMVARVALVVLLAALVTLTTRFSDIVDTLERALGPLRPFGVNPARIGLMLALTIRLIPMLFEIAQQVRMAQMARGVDRNAMALLVPLAIKTLRMADNLADAIDARGFDPR